MPAPFKRPESVLVIVYTQAGEVLVLRRRTPANYWQSVTGSLEWHETALQAARRELREETGIRAVSALTDCNHANRFPIVMPWKRRYAPGARLNLEHVFCLPLPDRRWIRLNSQEHSDFRWISWEKAARKVTSWTNREAILRFVGPQRPTLSGTAGD